MKLAVEEPESEALVTAMGGRGPYATSVVGEIETVRVCRRAAVPPAQIDELLGGLLVVALARGRRPKPGSRRVGPVVTLRCRCILRCMRRKQLYLEESTDRALKRLSARTGRSEAWHVREALRSYLDREHVGEDDPFDLIIGLVDEPAGPTDVAEHHDHYLYGARKDRP